MTTAESVAVAETVTAKIANAISVASESAESALADAHQALRQKADIQRILLDLPADIPGYEPTAREARKSAANAVDAASKAVSVATNQALAVNALTVDLAALAHRVPASADSVERESVRIQAMNEEVTKHLAVAKRHGIEAAERILPLQVAHKHALRQAQEALDSADSAADSE